MSRRIEKCPTCKGAGVITVDDWLIKGKTEEELAKEKEEALKDIVEVVRCKDCKYYDDGECDLHSEPKERRPYERWIFDVRENDYCSYGKKKRRRK